jgi:hypothetical protein
MSCREIQLEQAKVNGFTQAVEKESEFSGRSILSFLGDFGIGNMIEKRSAMESAENRARQMQTLSDQRRCTEAQPQAATASAPLPTGSR